MKMNDSLSALQDELGYTFKDVSLLNQALTSPAYRMDHPAAADNQRLEFLGDAVFDLLSAEALYALHPDESEGALTVRRTQRASGVALSACASRFHLESYVLQNLASAPLLPGSKVLADAMEAILGAAWLDGGLVAVRMIFSRMVEESADEPLDPWAENPKGHLQVLAQARGVAETLRYEVLKKEGPCHAPVYTVCVSVADAGSATGVGSTKRAAEAAAARTLLALLAQQDGGAQA